MPISSFPDNPIVEDLVSQASVDNTYLVEAKGLTKAFDGILAVNHVDLRVRTQEIFGLIGPNGAGKSTLIKMLTTLLPPTSGDARVAGCDIRREAPQLRARIGYVPQLLSADGALTGYENLLLSARLYQIPTREQRRRIDEALELTQLTTAANRLAQHYSGGMLRRLEIAQSTLHRPALLIMDEPTVGLDPVGRDLVWEHMRELQARYGTTILFTTHTMDEADELCDRIGILHFGRLEKVGTPTELKAELGPDATLDEVFFNIAGQDIGNSQAGNYQDVRLARRSARQHG